MPPVSVGKCGAQEGVGILCVATGGEGEPGENGGAEKARYVWAGVQDGGSSGGVWVVKREPDRNEHCGDVGSASQSGIAAGERVGMRAYSVLKGWHGALGVHQRNEGEKEETNRLDSHIRLHGTLIQNSEAGVRRRLCESPRRSENGGSARNISRVSRQATRSPARPARGWVVTL